METFVHIVWLFDYFWLDKKINMVFVCLLELF